VEDDNDVRELVSLALKNFGYYVIEAESGLKAIDYINENETSIDLMITDIIMPGINGKELALRLNEKISLDRVLFVSGYSQDHLLQNGPLQQGINFLQKPYPIDLGLLLTGPMMQPNIAFSLDIRNLIDGLHRDGTYKTAPVIDSPMDTVVRLKDGSELINLCSNNYLGLANHPDVISGASKAMEKYGYGTASVRFICGTFTAFTLRSFNVKVHAFPSAQSTYCTPVTSHYLTFLFFFSILIYRNITLHHFEVLKELCL